jgi:hypothetical protein
MSQGRPRPAKAPKGALTYDALLSLAEDDIQALFPYGANQIGGKFIPATESPIEEGHVSLKGLMRDKRKRLERPNYLGKVGGYTSNPAHALQTDPEVGEAPPKAVLAEFSENGWHETQKRRDAVPLSDQIRDIEAHLRPEQRAELRRRIQAFKRSMNRAA